MALDWNKEISFSGLKKKGGGGGDKSAYPTKRYINLAPRNAKEFNAKSTIPKIVVAAVVAVLLLKFGVFDLFGQVGARQAALDAENARTSQLQTQLADYNKVLFEYESYESTSLSLDKESVNALDALSIVDRIVAPAASVKSLSYGDNVMSLTLTNISLDGLGELANRLKAEDEVVNVSVSTAATQATDSADVSAAMVVTLQRVIEE